MSGAALKLLALLTMTIDHVGYLFFPDQLWLRLVGRLAFPIFAFSAAQGARYTHNRRRYLLRLLAWALVAEIPFDLFGAGVLFSLHTANVLWTLAAGVACCWLLETRQLPAYARYLVVLLLMVVSTVFMTDYMFPGVLAVIFFYHYIGKGKLVQGGAIACTVLSFCFGLVQLPCLLSLIPLHYYNGKPGPRLKYLFYLYYPAHMLLLWGVYRLLQGGFAR